MDFSMFIFRLYLSSVGWNMEDSKQTVFMQTDCRISGLP